MFYKLSGYVPCIDKYWLDKEGNFYSLLTSPRVNHKVYGGGKRVTNLYKQKLEEIKSKNIEFLPLDNHNLYYILKDGSFLRKRPLTLCKGYPRVNITMLTGEKKVYFLHDIISLVFLGRPLDSELIVHHVDRNKLNFNPSNLILMDKSNHRKLHWQQNNPEGFNQYTGKKNPQKTSSRKYYFDLLVTKEGKYILIKDIGKYCKDNNLSRGGFNNIINGKRSSYKGYKFISVKIGNK